MTKEIKVKVKNKMGRMTLQEKQTKQEKCLAAINRGEYTKEQLCDIVQIAANTLNHWLGDEEFIKKIDKQRNKDWIFYMPQIDRSVREKALSNGSNSMVAARTIYEKRGEINGDTVRQPITIVFTARSDGIIKRPFEQPIDVKSVPVVENIKKIETNKNKELLPKSEKTTEVINADVSE